MLTQGETVTVDPLPKGDEPIGRLSVARAGVLRECIDRCEEQQWGQAEAAGEYSQDRNYWDEGWGNSEIFAWSEGITCSRITKTVIVQQKCRA